MPTAVESPQAGRAQATKTDNAEAADKARDRKEAAQAADDKASLAATRAEVENEAGVGNQVDTEG